MTDSASLPDAGLSASELAQALAELGAHLAGAEVLDVALLENRDDLLLFVEAADGRHALHLAPGGRRARVCLTRRRFLEREFSTGPRPDHVREILRGSRVVALEQPDGERRCTVRLTSDRGVLAIECELFGNRGLWALCDDGGSILALSRLPNVAGRTLRPGARYRPPAARPATSATPTTRFSPPVLDIIDRVFTALDLDEEARSEHDEVERALDRETSRRQHRLAGLERQRAAMAEVAELRLAADMLLAYGPSLPPGATELRVAHPFRVDDEIVIPRDARVPAHVQAESLYKKARKHEDGRAITERQIAEVSADLAELRALRDRLDAADGHATVRPALERRGLLKPTRPARPDAGQRRLQKLTGGENFRRFQSAEGMLILIGRDDRQNDRLTSRIARGNDLWLHVGRGYAGSHVVVRVPKGKTASLETLLDAATLAVHYSKVRGAELEEVLYTQAKNVRKAKGMPPGKVLTSRTKSIRVRIEPDRLRRLLSTSDNVDPSR